MTTTQQSTGTSAPLWLHCCDRCTISPLGGSEVLVVQAKQMHLCARTHVHVQADLKQLDAFIVKNLFIS